MKNKSSISFPKRFIMSIKDIDKYSTFTEQKFLNGFYYFSILIAIFSLIVTIVSVICLNYLKNDFISEVQKLPDFKIENNKFSIDWEEDIINEDSYFLNNILNTVFGNEISNMTYNTKTKILLSNSIAPDTLSDEDKNYEGVFVGVYSNRIILYSLENSISYSYENLTNNYGLKEVIDKQEFIDAVNNAFNARMVISIFLGFLLSNYLLNLFNVLTFALLGFFLGKIMGLKLPYGKVLNIAFSAITLPLVLQLVYKIIRVFTGFQILHFDILFTIISYLYISVSLYLIYKNDKTNTSKQRIKTIKEEIEEKLELEEVEAEAEKEKEDVKKKDRETEKKRKKKSNDNQKPEPQANFKEM